MKETHLETVIALQKTLDRLKDARQRLEGIPDWMRELHDQHSERRAEIEALENEIEQSRLDRRNAEGAVQEQQEKLKRFQQQINAVKTQREYGALLQEIDTAKEEIRNLEEQELEAMERRETAEQSLTEKRQAFQELDQRYKAELEKWEEEKPGVEREVRELEAQAEKNRQRLPRPVLSQFERLRDRLDDQALAAIRTVQRPGRGPQTWHCAACNYRVRPQVVVQIRNQGSILQCDSCKRILYVEDLAGETPGEGSDAGSREAQA